MNTRTVIFIAIVAAMVFGLLGAKAAYRSYGSDIVDPSTGLSVYKTVGAQRDQIMRTAVDEGGRVMAQPARNRSGYTYDNSQHTSGSYNYDTSGTVDSYGSDPFLLQD